MVFDHPTYTPIAWLLHQTRGNYIKTTSTFCFKTQSTSGWISELRVITTKLSKNKFCLTKNKPAVMSSLHGFVSGETCYCSKLLACVNSTHKKFLEFLFRDSMWALFHPIYLNRALPNGKRETASGTRMFFSLARKNAKCNYRPLRSKT